MHFFESIHKLLDQIVDLDCCVRSRINQIQVLIATTADDEYGNISLPCNSENLIGLSSRIFTLCTIFIHFEMSATIQKVVNILLF
jgi:hypothetical protein